MGFDQTNPYQEVDISSWVVEFARSKKMIFKDNRALAVPCYNPEYTFVEKLQAVTNKYKQFQVTGKLPRNFLRHYYDIHQLVDIPQVQKFIGTEDYLTHKKKRFKSLDQNIAASDAFTLKDKKTRELFESEYAKTAALYYRGQIAFQDILTRIHKDLARL